MSIHLHLLIGLVRVVGCGRGEGGCLVALSLIAVLGVWRAGSSRHVRLGVGAGLAPGWAIRMPAL